MPSRSASARSVSDARANRRRLANRIRSIADSTSSGLVSHTWAWISHSFGPRDPKRDQEVVEPVEKVDGVGVARAAEAFAQSGDARIEGGVIAGESATSRDISHIA